MGAWLRKYSSWDGKTSRDEYRRLLPFLLTAHGALLWLMFAFAQDGQLHWDRFGPIGGPLFVIGTACYVGWFLLTARRLRSANISRGWMIPAVLVIILPVAGYHVNITMIAALALTAVGAIARDNAVAA